MLFLAEIKCGSRGGTDLEIRLGGIVCRECGWVWSR